MASVTNRFPLWGDTGEAPQSGFLYSGGDQVNEKHLNYLWDKVQKQTDDFITKTDDLQAQITAIDANGDGIVDEADTANLYKGNDIDTNGDGKVNAADTADTASLYKGNDIDTNGDGRVDAADTTNLYKGQDIDSNGDGKVNSADTADSATTAGLYKGNDIDTNGDGQVDSADFADIAGNAIPSGGIIMWSGTTADIPSGWTLCNGLNGAPDLQNRFVVGAGDSYTAGNTGGADSVTLTENEMPSHSHVYTKTTTTYSNTGEGNNANVFSGTTGANTGLAGGDAAHENRPPFYALAFIMKL